MRYKYDLQQLLGLYNPLKRLHNFPPGSTPIGSQYLANRQRQKPNSHRILESQIDKYPQPPLSDAMGFFVWLFSEKIIVTDLLRLFLTEKLRFQIPIFHAVPRCYTGESAPSLDNL